MEIYETHGYHKPKPTKNTYKVNRNQLNSKENQQVKRKKDQKKI